MTDKDRVIQIAGELQWGVMAYEERGCMVVELITPVTSLKFGDWASARVILTLARFHYIDACAA